MRPKTLLRIAAILDVSFSTLADDDNRLKAVLVHNSRTNVHRSIASETTLARLEFCAYCSDPQDEGSFVYGLTALQGLQHYRVNSSLVYAVPNDASRQPMNRDEASGKLVVCERGAVPLVQKVLAIQAVGALGVVIVDDGQCSVELDCGRAGSPRMGGFAPKDDPEAWRQVTIPAALVSSESGARLRKLMPLDHQELPNLGYQYLSKKQRKRRSSFDL